MSTFAPELVPQPVKSREPWYSNCVDLSLLLTPGDLIDEDFADWAATKLRPVLHTNDTLQVDGGGYMTLDFRPVYPTFYRTTGHVWQYIGRRPRGARPQPSRF